MKQDVIAIFDIGKTNKKFLLFDKKLNLVHQEETIFEEIKDDDGYPCDDIIKLIAWMRSSIERTVLENKFNIRFLNFSTYGASLIYLNKEGKRITPLYNYLKPMPEGILNGFYEAYGGKEEFCRKTASPALDMLNSGLQVLWLKKSKPELWKEVAHILHLPQFISYHFTGEIVSGYPSIGCHTAMWDFDNKAYHQWLADEEIILPDPFPSDALYDVQIGNSLIKTGVGIHDSSASLVPYLKKFHADNFMLVSTGTWAINMNPFNAENLTSEELNQDCLCYLSVEQQQVKSSRLFLGHIHDVNTKIICDHFGICSDVFKSIKTNEAFLQKIIKKGEMKIFPNGMTKDYVGDTEVLKSSESPIEAYHQLMYEITKMEAHAIMLAMDKNDSTKKIFITGGFVKNDIFCRLLATLLENKQIYKAELYNATALGTAMIVNKEIDIQDIKIELEEVVGFN
jgi:sugar (pentulose or hexulose) kinase